ncbi:prolyl oligopeptidase family serine peptidase [Cellulomonas shaoxiangyii]|uniref:carboxylesterase family protein n=1 Tax=Cellulomonas shaoxiangyii TaxID=2566013 RepID=UPI00140B4518|nr:prolyl oligopeptidase family serine peptidase [Cellulomonas shaoxiangyii]
MAAAALAVGACGTGTTEPTATSSSTTTTPTGSASPSATSSASGTATGDAVASPSLESLQEQVVDQFEPMEYDDAEAGLTIRYHLFLPEGYDGDESYPMVVFISDSSRVGDDVGAPLADYGALIWASEQQQARQPTLVLVPQYPEVIIDDLDGHTVSDYVDMTAGLIRAVQEDYEVDSDRIYGTGQSMGAMTVMYLAAQQPDLFAAELLVSGQWDTADLQGLTEETFVYVAAGGDERATRGQDDVEAMLDEANVPFGTATWDATWSPTRLEEAADELLADDDRIYFVTFEAGTVLEAGGSDDGRTSEHMASFQPAYEIAALRDWLVEQED